jgi:hypothetical protein
MRPQLLVGGILVSLMGILFYLVPLPLTYFWGIPFVVAGGIMAIVSFFLPEGRGPIVPPLGYGFCVFCSAPVLLNSDRCPRCNGLQPRER